MAGTAEIRSRAGLDNSGFMTGIKGMQRETEAWAKGQLNQLKGQIAGAFSVGAVIAFGKSIVDCAKDLQDQSDTLNVTTDSLQAYQKLARENGSDQDKLATALTKTQTAQMELLAGTDKMVAAFGALGIKAKDVEGLGTDQVFALIGQKVYEADDQTAAFNATTDILGSKLAGNLIPTLKAVGEDGLQTVIDKAKESGEVLSADVIAKIDMFGDRLEALAKKAKVLAVDVADTASAQAEGILSFWAAWIAGDDLDAAAAKSQKAINDVYEAQDAAVQKAVAAQQKGNELILETTTKTADQQVKEADRVALARELGVKKAADAEERYNERVEKISLGRIPLEDKIVALRAKQAELLEQIGLAEEKGLGKALETFDLKNKLLDVQQDLARAEELSAQGAEQSQKAAEKAAIPWNQLSTQQADTLIKLKDALAGMTDDEVTRFVEVLTNLVDGLVGLVFPDMSELAVISDFKIPNESPQNAKQFGRALAEMAAIIQGIQFGDLSALELIKDFEIPNESPANARQFGRALAAVAQGIKDAGFDKAMIESLTAFFTAAESLGPGKFEVKVTGFPNSVALDVDKDFTSNISQIAAYLGQVAAMKGIIWA